MRWIRRQQGLGAVCLLLASWIAAAEPLQPEAQAAYAGFLAKLPPAGQYRVESSQNIDEDNVLPGPARLRCLTQENLRDLADEPLGIVGKAPAHLVCDPPVWQMTAQRITHEQHCKAIPGYGIQNIAVLRAQLEIQPVQTVHIVTEQILKERSLDGVPQADLQRKESITAARVGDCPQASH